MINSRSRALQSPKQIQKKRNKLIITSSLIFLCSIIFIILIILFFRLAFLQISNIIVNGNPTIAFSEIENETYLTFNGEYLNIIPRSSSIFYSKSKIEKNLIDKFKKIDSLNIKQKGISTLEINIKEKETVAVVCDGFHDDDLQSADQKCYSVDKNGYVFEESVILSESVYPHYYIDLSKNTNIIGSNFIDNKMFLDLQNFINIIQNSHISVIGILIGENDQYELYVRNKDNTEAVVYFDNKNPLEKLANNFVLFWNDAMAKKKNPTVPIFDYINLKFGNNIFYATK